MSKLDNFYWNPNKSLTKNRNIMFFIGPRGVGKTYGIKKWCIKRFIKYDEQFIYMRRHESELETVSTLFNDLFGDEDFEGYNFRVAGREMQIKKDTDEDWSVMGFILALSTSYKFKATSYPKVKYLFYDEFLYEKGDVNKELKQEINKFFNVLETVFRNRPFKVFMVGNATTFETCYKYGLGLQEPYDSNIWYHKTKPIMVEKVENPAYLQAKKDSVLGQLVKGTEYENYAIDNNFFYDNKSYIKKKKGNFRYVLGFYYKGVKYAIFTDDEKCIIDKTNVEPGYIIKDEDMDKENLRVLFGTHPVIRYLKKFYNVGCMFYQNMEVKTALHGLFYKIL